MCPGEELIVLLGQRAWIVCMLQGKLAVLEGGYVPR
jgi:hypothetical protein